MYIKNLKHAHLTPVFRLHNIHLVFSNCTHKYKKILCTEKPVLNASFKDFLCTKINNHSSEKKDKYVFKGINSLHTTQISSLFIVFFEKSDAKIKFLFFIGVLNIFYMNNKPAMLIMWNWSRPWECV